MIRDLLVQFRDIKDREKANQMLSLLDNVLDIQTLLSLLYIETHDIIHKEVFSRLLRLIEENNHISEINDSLGLDVSNILNPDAIQDLYSIANSSIPYFSTYAQNKIREKINSFNTLPSKSEIEQILSLPEKEWLDKTKIESINWQLQLNEENYQPHEFSKLYRILGCSSEELNDRLRSNNLSTSSFLGMDENFEDVVLKDLVYLASKDITHKEFAKIVSYVISDKIVLRRLQTKYGEFELINVGGITKYRMTHQYRGYQLCPFTRVPLGSTDYEFYDNVRKKYKLKISSCMPYFISRFGFFEGTKVDYRLDPRKFLAFFTINNPKSLLDQI